MSKVQGNPKVGATLSVAHSGMLANAGGPSLPLMLLGGLLAGDAYSGCSRLGAAAFRRSLDVLVREARHAPSRTAAGGTTLALYDAAGLGAGTKPTPSRAAGEGRA